MAIYTKIFSALWDITMFIGFYAALGAFTLYVLFTYDKYVEQKRQKQAEQEAKKAAERKAAMVEWEKKNAELAAAAAARQEAHRQAQAAEHEARVAEYQAANERAEAERKQQKAEWRTRIRAEMDPDLVSLLDELNIFDWTVCYGQTVGEKFYHKGIKTITILAGRNAGGGGGIQPQKLEKEYNIPAGVAVDLKQKAIARLQRPARSPARVRPAAANTA